MMRYCENCWENFDTEKEGAGIYFCPKCILKLKEREIEHETN